MTCGMDCHAAEQGIVLVLGSALETVPRNDLSR